MEKVTRRMFVAGFGAATVIPTVALTTVAETATPEAKKMPPAEGGIRSYIFFDSEEALFIEAATERLIPADELGAGAVGAGVPNYLDKQLGGAWGAGERLYRSGPWALGTPSQGYQLPFTPSELFRVSLRAINRDLERGTPFHEMASDVQDAYLKSLESGAHDLNGVPSAVFFDIFLKMTVEGFFSDPVYGGNRDMVAWRMIGFPGAYADYYEAIDKHGEKFVREPMSLAEDSRGHIHMRQDIPAKI
jgi:gluconate 2-dehydrogenase gamma chain